MVSTATITNPAIANLFFLKNSVIPDAGVHDGIEQIGDEIDEDIRERDRQDAPLYEWIIAGVDRLNRQPSQARPGKHRLRDDCAGEQDSCLKPQHSDDRDQTI